MFDKVLIANRGDQPSLGGVAAKPNRLVAENHTGDFATEVRHVQ
jgi:hypothetical protein